MQTIGERLEEARKRKGVSVREAAELTKIRGDYLQKFEANSFDIDLPPLYIRGFIRTYARFLELDPERLVSDVDATLAREGKQPPRREQREALGRVDFGSEPRASQPAETAGGNDRSARDQAMMLKLALLGGGAIAAIVVVILLINLFFSHSPAKPASSVAQTPPAPAVQAETAQTLVLTAVEATRVKVVQDLDKAEIFNGSLARGESKSLKKQGKLGITVEVGKNLRMEVNGRSYPVPIDGYGRFYLD